MKLQIALPASALLLSLSAVASLRAPQTETHSTIGFVARAGVGVIRAIAGAGDRGNAPEVAQSAAPLTLAASRPDSVEPAQGSTEVAAIEHYHEWALEAARAKSTLVVVDTSEKAAVKSFAIAEFEKKCDDTERAVAKKAKCTRAALEVPVMGCYLERATSLLVS